jgi:hypothetical protein
MTSFHCILIGSIRHLMSHIVHRTSHAFVIRNVDFWFGLFSLSFWLQIQVFHKNLFELFHSDQHFCKVLHFTIGSLHMHACIKIDVVFILHPPSLTQETWTGWWCLLDHECFCRSQNIKKKTMMMLPIMIHPITGASVDEGDNYCGGGSEQVSLLCGVRQKRDVLVGIVNSKQE